MKEIGIEEFKKMLLHVCEKIEEKEPLLTDLDREIGDGDHGYGMKIGFEAVKKYLEKTKKDDLFEILKDAGYEFVNTVGGVTGPIFGTFFLGMAKAVRGRKIVDSETFSKMLRTAYEDIKRRGKAEEGGKTMVDALGPAVRASEKFAGEDLDKALEEIAKASKEGAERTKDMLAKFGRARTLGERVLGTPDPGAVSMSIILEAMSEYLKSLKP